MHLPDNEYIILRNNNNHTQGQIHNIKLNFDKILHTIKSLEVNDFDQTGNVKRVGPKPKFSDLEVISLNLTAEYMSIDSENLLFKKLLFCHRDDFPTLIDRTQYNRRKKYLIGFTTKSVACWPKNLLNLKITSSLTLYHWRSVEFPGKNG